MSAAGFRTSLGGRDGIRTEGDKMKVKEWFDSEGIYEDAAELWQLKTINSPPTHVENNSVRIACCSNISFLTYNFVQTAPWQAARK